MQCTWSAAWEITTVHAFIHTKGHIREANLCSSKFFVGRRNQHISQVNLRSMKILCHHWCPWTFVLWSYCKRYSVTIEILRISCRWINFKGQFMLDEAFSFDSLSHAMLEPCACDNDIWLCFVKPSTTIWFALLNS